MFLKYCVNISYYFKISINGLICYFLILLNKVVNESREYLVEEFLKGKNF